MANAFFRLRKVKSKKAEMIYLGFRFGKDQLIYSTGLKVVPKHWDFAKSRVKNVLDVSNKDEINSYLVEVSDFVNSLSNSYKSRKQLLTKEAMKEELDRHLAPQTAVEEPELITFFAFIDQFITDLESGRRLIKGNRIADGKTVQRYRTAKNSLQKFQDHSGVVLHWDNCTESRWREYVTYLTFVEKYKINNIGFYQKQLLILLKAARKEGLIDAAWIDDMTVLSENPVDVYLTKKELDAIVSHDLSSNERLDRVRDLLLIGCYTGFRISDWSQIKEENIRVTSNGNRYIEIIPDKENATPPSAPLSPIVEQILAKYDGVLPVISDQKFNQYVKELCKEAKINEKIKVKYVLEGRTRIDTVEKHTQVSSHTCRRSYATNMFLDGVEPYLIMKATGHTSEKNFIKYLKLDNSGSVDAIAERKKSTP